MRTSKGGIFFGFAFLLAGCAIHPLPEDVTGEKTFYIVQKIRCEARDALTDISVSYLRRSLQPETLRLADRVERRELKVTDLFEGRRDLPRVDPFVHGYFDTFALTTVGFEFTFDIMETNDNQAVANFRNPFATGTFTLDAKAGGRFDRQNKRRFLVGDTFLELYDLLEQDYCDRIAAGHKDFIYPITGKIGLEEVFGTFIKLNSRGLDPYSPRLAAAKASGAVEGFVDTLTFTTTLTASANPKVVLNPIPDNRFRLADASVNVAATRKDIHQVAVTVVPGQPVASLAEARQKAKIDRQKLKAFRQLFQNRTEDFFETQKDILRRLDELRR